MKLFEHNGHAIIWGDAVETLTTEIPDKSVDLVFADPPYNIGKSFNGRKDRWPSDEAYLSWCYQWLELCIAKLKPTGSLYVMTATQNMPLFDLFLRQRLTILSRIVWAYDSSGVQARNYFGSLYEPILYCVADKDHYTFNHSNNVAEYAAALAAAIPLDAEHVEIIRQAGLLHDIGKIGIPEAILSKKDALRYKLYPPRKLFIRY